MPITLAQVDDPQVRTGLILALLVLLAVGFLLILLVLMAGRSLRRSGPFGWRRYRREQQPTELDPWRESARRFKADTEQDDADLDERDPRW